jgi:hypothetical protein
MSVDLIALEQQITDLLTGLGHCGDDVATSIDGYRIRGVRGDACDCPVARLIFEQIPGLKKVEVEDGKVRAELANEDGTIEVPLTPAVQDFAWAFDAFVYPGLVERGAVA